MAAPAFCAAATAARAFHFCDLTVHHLTEMQYGNRAHNQGTYQQKRNIIAGVTYELPRLWVAFVPPLTLAVAAGWPALRGSSDIPHPRVAKLPAIIVIEGSC